MVLSRINTTIEYTDKTKIEENDKNMNTELYEIKVQAYSLSIMIAIGKYNKIKNVLFLPIYLFYNNKFVSQIGIFEYEITKENEKERDFGLLSKNGDVMIERLSEPPLFYSFVTKDYLHPYTHTKNTAATAAKRGGVWVQKYMKDNDYNIIHTEMDYNGDADSLFTAIKIALSDVRKYISISTMRDIVAKNVSKNVYDMYKNEYDNAEKELQTIKTRVKELIERNKYYETKIKNTNIRNEKIMLVKEAEENIKLFNDTKRELKLLNEKYKMISFMKGINTIEQLKSLIKSSLFYADKWVISILEREMNIKLVLFSQEAFNVGDIYNVLDCMSMSMRMAVYDGNNTYNGNTIDYYILISYIKKDYQLITYRRRCAFEFKQLNNGIKQLIVDKIHERNAGIYAYIPDVISYLKQEKITLKSAIEQQLQSDLYSGETVFQIYEYSNDNFEPGKGVGERLDKSEVEKYKELRNCESWRRKLYQFSKYQLSKYQFSHNMNLKEKISDEFASILRKTKNAKIVYFEPQKPPVLATVLMKLRKSLYV